VLALTERHYFGRGIRGTVLTGLEKGPLAAQTATGLRGLHHPQSSAISSFSGALKSRHDNSSFAPLGLDRFPLAPTAYQAAEKVVSK